MSATDPMSRRRGALVGFLVVYALSAMLAGGRLVGEWIDRVQHGQRATVLLVLALATCLLQLIAVAAIWAWRRWGAYLLGGLVVIGVIVEIAAGTPGWIVALQIVLAGGLAFSLLPHWDRMVD